MQTYRPLLVALLAVIIVATALTSTAIAQDIRIGVLANRGNETALKMWMPTAAYLDRLIPDHHFVIVPLDFHQIDQAVSNKEVDFIISNPEIYVNLEAKYRVSRMATLKNKTINGSSKKFGGVIFTRSDRNDIRSLRELMRKKIMAVEETSLGGWTMAWRELKVEGINPYRDFAGLSFGGTHDTVVYAVRDRKVDAGCVRSDTLERMSTEGKINRADYFVINQQKNTEGFPFAVSTQLYPEWPFAKVRHASDDLAESVAIALYSLPADDPAAKSSNSEGWTIPLDYQSVHELMKELRIGAYKDYGKITLSSAIRQYWYWLVAAPLLLLLMSLITVYVLRLNRILRKTKLDLERSSIELEMKVKERTAELHQANENLNLELAERKQAEEERAHLAKQLLHAQKLESLGVMAGGIAHDFNNLLQSILGNIELALIKLAPESEPHRYIVNAMNSGKHATDLTTMMLTYVGKGFIAKKELNLNELVRENAEMLKTAASKAVSTEISLSAELPLISADEAHIQQVVMNLIINASEAIELQPGIIRLATGIQECDQACLAASLLEEKPEPGRFVFLEVIDNGCGMSEETLKRLFDPFFTTKFTGRGLGMSAVMGIIRTHGGALFVESEPGKGTTFRVLLPVSESAPPATIQKSVTPSPMHCAPPENPRTGVALVVDDERPVLKVCTKMVQLCGFTVITACDGIDAVTKFREHADKIVVVLMDLTMPNMDGLSAMNEIQSIRPDIKVILSSGFNEEELSDRITGHYPSGFIRKPYSVNVLEAELRRVMQPE